MTIYGATANTKGGLFGDSAGLAQLPSIGVNTTNRVIAAKALGTKGTFAIRAALAALVGAAPGGAASYTFPSIDASTSELGGKRTITQVSLINRVTTAADVTEIGGTVDTWSTRTTFGKTPPINKDRSPLGEQR